MIDSIYLVRKLNDTDSNTVRFVAAVVARVASRCPTPIPIITDRVDVKATTLVIAIGGDGTMLQAMSIAQCVSAFTLGINLGRVGFLTDFPNDGNLAAELLEIFNGASIPIEHRMSLKTQKQDGTFHTAFNEIVISNRFSDVPIKYHLKIDDLDAGYHRANSIIIGTPTGSTAYTLSAGGGLLLPSMCAMQIIPVAPLSITSRPIVVPGDVKVTVSVVETSGSWVLKGDGNIITIFNDPGEVTIERARNVAVIHPKGWNFFNMLTSKLGWKNGL